MDKFSYAIGLGIGQNLLSMGAKGIDVEDFAQAIKDVLDGNKTAITHTEARDIVNKYFEEMEPEDECCQHRGRQEIPGRKQETPGRHHTAQRTAI